MKLIPSNPISKTSPKNKFKIEIEFMEGDADGTQYETILFDSIKFVDDIDYKSDVEYLINTIDKAIESDKRGRGGYDDLNEVLTDHYQNEGLNYFLKNDELYEYEEEHTIVSTKTKHEELMFYCPSNDMGFYHSFQNCKITYFNQDGIEHFVEIKK